MLGSLDARQVYYNAKRTLKKNKVDITKARLSQGFLRFEIQINANSTDYLFNVLVNQSNGGQPTYPSEKRLELQDSFFISHMSVFLMMAATGGGDTQYKYYPLTYPSGTFNGSWNPFGMYKFWAGSMSLTVNNNVLCPAWDLYKHLYAPQTQRPDWQGPFPISQFYPFVDQKDGSQDGFYPVEPNWVLVGSKNNQLALSLPENLGTDLGLSTVRAVCIVRGVLAQNSTSVH